jgi:hypothetical protein
VLLLLLVVAELAMIVSILYCCRPAAAFGAVMMHAIGFSCTVLLLWLLLWLLLIVLLWMVSQVVMLGVTIRGLHRRQHTGV